MYYNNILADVRKKSSSHGPYVPSPWWDNSPEGAKHLRDDLDILHDFTYVDTECLGFT